MWYLCVSAAVGVVLQVWMLYKVFHIGERHIERDEANTSLLLTIFAIPIGLTWPVVLIVLIWSGLEWANDKFPGLYRRWYNRRVDEARERRRLAEQAARAKRLEETKYFP